MLSTKCTCPKKKKEYEKVEEKRKKVESIPGKYKQQQQKLKEQF